MSVFEKILHIGNSYHPTEEDFCTWCGNKIEGKPFVETFNEVCGLYDDYFTRELFCETPCYLQAILEWTPRNQEVLKRKAEEKKRIRTEKRRSATISN